MEWVSDSIVCVGSSSWLIGALVLRVMLMDSLFLCRKLCLQCYYLLVRVTKLLIPFCLAFFVSSPRPLSCCTYYLGWLCI